MANDKLTLLIEGKETVSPAAGKATKSLDTFGKRAQKLSASMRAFGRSMTLFVTAPILALGGVMIKTASDAEETRSKFNTIFRDIEEGANSMADEFAKSYGLAGSTSRELLGNTADLLTGFKFTQKEALNLARQVNELGVDLASFTNFSGGAKGASEALTKALLGERESVKSLGISILEVDVKAKIASMEATGELTDETDRQKKAMATLAIAVEQSANAVGDYERTQESTANRMKLFREVTKELSEEIGENLLPVFTSLLEALLSLVQWFTGLSETTQNVIIVVALAVAALGPLLAIIGNVIVVVKALGVAMAFLAANPIVLIIAAVAALVLGIAYLITHWDDVKQAMLDAWEKVSPVIMPIIGAITDAVEWLTEKVKDLIHWLGELIRKASEALDKLPGMGLAQRIGKAFDFSGRAAGGPVMGGTPYIVGEQGPEVFVPGRSGGIVPNHAMGGVTINIQGDVYGDNIDELFDRAVGRLQLSTKVV